MAVRFRATDPSGVDIECAEQNWLDHVERHPEIVGRESWVQETIQQPMGIYQSTSHADRQVYYRQYDFGRPLGRAYLRVIVAYNEVGPAGRTTGFVVSAHAAIGPRKGEVMIWPVD
ncbi:MAG: hypothetical protein HYX51_01170 [Chloroflexi bacterium]|nr:hypothetical protein [Chloroflexota bacterium]